MSDTRNGDHYSAVAIMLHWMMAVLVVANLAIGLLHDSLLKGTMGAHKAIGITVLTLAVVRLVWRLTHRPPPLPATVRPWEKGLAHGVHWCFYALIILIPLSGWVFTSASPTPRPISFFGLFPVPFLPIGPDKALSSTVATRHGQLAYLMIALLCLHVAGALKHRFVDRDRTLERMLPGAGPA